ncbi:hypothetical protein [Amycolatopsis sp. lyj-112]|uniref:hypothetical protein n=1 Tax=Amycolatopsis sp. lyj-112 TaxID=2789288 RepID=UPI00397B09BF
MAQEPADQPEPPPAVVDGEPPSHRVGSPIPMRGQKEQYELTLKLLELPTLAERVTHLLEHESIAYLVDKVPVVEPAALENAPKRGPKRPKPKRFWAPGIAIWLESATGESVSKEGLYRIRDGKSLRPRGQLINGLADFWRIDPRLLDTTIPASHFEDPEAGIDELTPLDRRMYELMNDIGLHSVNPREIQQSLLGSSTEADKRLLLGMLEGIAQHQHAADDKS